MKKIFRKFTLLLLLVPMLNSCELDPIDYSDINPSIFPAEFASPAAGIVCLSSPFVFQLKYTSAVETVVSSRFFIVQPTVAASSQPSILRLN